MRQIAASTENLMIARAAGLPVMTVEYLDDDEGILDLSGNGASHGHYSHDLMAERALRFVRENRDRPFFLYAAFTLPHFSSDDEDPDGSCCRRKRNRPPARTSTSATTVAAVGVTRAVIRCARAMGAPPASTPHASGRRRRAA